MTAETKDGRVEIDVKEAIPEEDRELFAEAVVLYREQSVVERTAKATKRELMAETIRPLAERVDADAVVGDGWRVVREAGRKTLSVERLLKQGVSARVIEKAYVEGERFYKVVKGKRR